MKYKKTNKKTLNIVNIDSNNSLAVPLVVFKNKFFICTKKNTELNYIIYGKTENHLFQGKVVLKENAKMNFYLLLWECHDLSIKIDFLLSGQNARSQINILALAGNRDQHRFDLHLQHQHQDTYSHIKLKRILWQQANSSSKEILKIDKNAGGADAHLSDRTVLMGNNSKAISQPILEILNDKVQVVHDATSGRLSEPEIFYLRSRGLDEASAKSLLLDSFIEEVMPADQKISNLIKQHLNSYVKFG